jgi:hypothetical protein
MEKQTAVKWLFEQVWITSGEDLPELLEQAKEMHKEEIENAFNYGQFDLGMEADEYYKQTFKSE